MSEEGLIPSGGIRLQHLKDEDAHITQRTAYDLSPESANICSDSIAQWPTYLIIHGADCAS